MQHVLPRFFSVIVFFSQTISAFYNTHQVRCYHFFIVEIIVESVNLIKMLKQNIIFFHHEAQQLRFYIKYHEGEQLRFYIKYHEGKQLRFYIKVQLKTQSKKQDVLVISKQCRKRRILIYLTKAVLKKRQMPYMNKWAQMNCN